MKQFFKNKKLIKDHNATKAGYSLDVNKFSDWSEEEYNRILTFRPLKGRRAQIKLSSKTNNTTTNTTNVFDWRTLGAVTSVKD